MARTDISLLAFALAEYERRSWEMPAVHVRVYDWLARTDGQRVRVLRVFRGCGKSTILGIRNAHKIRQNPLHQILVQGADDDLAHDLSRDTMAVLEGNELARGLLRNPAGVEQWWTHEGYKHNARTPQFRGKGILSRTTGNRADEIQNDDVEVEKNVADDKARRKLRKKLTEQTHILKPGGSRLYVGTPHAHDSLYDELIAGGAQHLTIPLFAGQARYQKDVDRQVQFAIPSGMAEDGVWVFLGIGAQARLAQEGADYRINGGVVVFDRAPGCTVDVCVGNAWPERFHRVEMEHRRKECRTLNEWDSQYQLEAKPMEECRLDPDKMVPYDVEPTLRHANGEAVLMLGNMRMVGAKARWDCSLGKVNSDASAVSVVFTDHMGRLYWHRSIALTGELEEFAPDGKTLVGGQIKQLIDLLKPLAVPQITIETNGPGGFVPAIARKHLKKYGIAVRDDFSTTNKQKRILDAFEAPLSSGFLWAHVSVLDGPTYGQMRDFNPSMKDQPDDYIDAGAGAIADTPVRIGRQVGKPTGEPVDDWRQGAGVHEVQLET